MLGIGIGLTSRAVFGRAAGVSFPLNLEPFAWWSMAGTGTLRGDPSGNSETGDIQAGFATLDGAGDTVFMSQLDDLSGNGHHLTQTTAANQPAVGLAMISGKVVATFDGTNDNLLTGAWATQAQPNTIIGVARRLSTGASLFLVDGILSTNRHAMFAHLTGGNYSLFAGNTVQSNVSDDLTQHRIEIGEFNGASSRYLLEETALTSVTGENIGTHTLTGIRLGSTFDAASFLNMRFCELFFFNRLLNAGELTQITNYLRTKWAINMLGDDGSIAPFPEEITMISAGTAWSPTDSGQFGYSNINQEGLRHQAISTTLRAGVRYQATSWADETRHLALAVRNDDGAENWGAWTTYRYRTADPQTIGPFANNDHNVSAIGFDRDGVLHVTYNHHTDPLNYRVSVAPIETFNGTLSAEMGMVAGQETVESEVTYPLFFNDPSGRLYFMFRFQASVDGDWIGYVYDETTGWGNMPGTVSARIGDGATDPFYPDGAPWFDASFDLGNPGAGFMHLSGHFRATGDPNSNYDRFYVKWNGANWFQADDTAQTMPIANANAEIVDPYVTEVAMATSFHAIVSDSAGNPLMAYNKRDAAGFIQIYVAHHNGTSWTITQITSQATIPGTGDGQEIDTVTRLRLAIDRTTDTAYLFFNGYGQTAGIWVAISDPGDFTTWSAFAQVTDYSALHSTCPVYDRYRWENDGVFEFGVWPWRGPGNSDLLPAALLTWTPP